MASPFWKYFHDRLNWFAIFRPGPIAALMKGLALHMDETRADIVWLRDQWNPATCEKELVAKYGVSRGIARNRFDTDDSYRTRVVHAYSWHKLGGKVRGLEQILRESGFEAVVKNSEDSDLWAHFRLLLDLGNRFFGPDEAALFWYLATEYKPARSIIEALSTRSEIGGTFSISIGGCQKTRTQAFTWRWPFALESLPARAGTGLCGKSLCQSSLVNRQPEPGEMSPHPAFTAYSFTRSKVCPRQL